MAQFPDSGFYVGGYSGEFRCGCANKALGGKKWDNNANERHINGKKHKCYLKGKNTLQARLVVRASELVESEAAQNNQIDLQGTRSSLVGPADIAYHRRITWMMVGAGIALNKVALLRPGLEETSQKSL
jgi:hypothetical protein